MNMLMGFQNKPENAVKIFCCVCSLSFNYLKGKKKETTVAGHSNAF
jgi:hypothetical protein